MIAQLDVVKFLAEVIICENPQERLYEIMGPHAYNSLDIAKKFGSY